MYPTENTTYSYMYHHYLCCNLSTLNITYCIAVPYALCVLFGEKLVNFSNFYNGHERIILIIVVYNTYDILWEKFVNFNKLYNGYECMFRTYNICYTGEKFANFNKFYNGYEHMSKIRVILFGKNCEF